MLSSAPRWLFEQLGGEGTVWYMRGLAGHPADSDRHIGFQNALADYPEHHPRSAPGGGSHRLGSCDDNADRRPLR